MVDFEAPLDFRGFGPDGKWYNGNSPNAGILGGNAATDYPNYLKRKAKEGSKASKSSAFQYSNVAEGNTASPESDLFGGYIDKMKGLQGSKYGGMYWE